MKKARTTKITRMDKLDNFGNTSFIIELDNGDKGFYVSKNSNQTKFVVGSETEYNIEQKQGSKGTYFKITLPPSEFKPGGGRPTIDPRVQMAGFAASYTKDLIIGGKIGMQDFGVTFEMIYGEMISKLP